MTVVARLACDQPTAERLAAYLAESMDHAVCAAFEDDGGQWQLAVHFPAPPDEATLRAQVALAAGETAAAALLFETVAEIDWVAESLAGLRPVCAGRFLVHGAHDRAGVKPNDIGIEIEAALAFGTGHHGTTRGCLLALNALAKRRRATRILDIGTGSGVLAIAAAKLLRTRVVASDIDRVAVEAARGNARLNRAASAITFVRAVGTKARAIAARAPYDLIFANILLGPLTRLAVPLSRLAAPGGHIVLSGLLPGQANAALTIYRAQGLVLQRRIPLEGWVTLVLGLPLKTKPPRARTPGRLRAGESLRPSDAERHIVDAGLDQPVAALVERVWQQTCVQTNFAAGLLHARFDQRIHEAGQPSFARRDGFCGAAAGNAISHGNHFISLLLAIEASANLAIRL
jgi:ribosomal protein L11 methyltransferase